MNYFDKEATVIRFFQDNFSDDYSWYLPEEQNTMNELAKIVSSICSKESWKLWKDTSDKGAPPPDFVNDTEKLMMEVMRIDDHSRVDKNGRVANPVNALESKIQNRIKCLQKEGLLPSSGNDVFVNAITDLSSKEDHNYGFYVDSYNRILNKHKDSIELYRENHPDYKLIFFLFDESTPYVKANSAEMASEGVVYNKRYLLNMTDIHIPAMDKRFVAPLYDLDVDYILWFMPFKHINSRNELQIPNFIAIDIKSARNLLLLEYPYELMMSFEE